MRSGRITRVQPDSLREQEGLLASLVRIYNVHSAKPEIVGLMPLLAAMGATFALTESVVANTREKDDHLNGVAGGCAAGFLAGIRGMFNFATAV